MEWWKFRRLVFYLADRALRQCFKPSCTKLGNRDFVCKMAERIVHYSVILLINDRSKCAIYRAAFTKLSKIKSFKWAKSVIPEINALSLYFEIPLYTWYTSVYQVYPRAVLACICAEFLDSKLSEKSNFETPKGVPTEGMFTWRWGTSGRCGNMWWVTTLTCKRDEIKMRDHMDRRVNPPRQVPRLHVKTPLSTSCKEGMKLCGNYG